MVLMMPSLLFEITSVGLVFPSGPKVTRLFLLMLPLGTMNVSILIISHGHRLMIPLVTQWVSVESTLTRKELSMSGAEQCSGRAAITLRITAVEITSTRIVNIITKCLELPY